MKLSLSGFLFEDGYASQSLAFDRFCALARSAGYEGIELRDTQVKPGSPPSLKREIVRSARAEGVAVTCLTARCLPKSGPERDAFFLSYLALCRELDCGLLKISSDPAWLREAADQAQSHGVILATNNHVGGRLETTEGTRSYFAEISHPNFGLLYDAMHLSLAAQDYIGFIPECFRLTRNILIHSLRTAGPGDPITVEHAGKKWTRAFPDEAGIRPDWTAVLGIFKNSGYRGWVTLIENGWPADQRESVARRCAQALRTILLKDCHE